MPPLFEQGYSYAMTPEEIAKKWVSLKPNNFKFTSEKTVNYNCIAWAIGEDDKWMDADYFQELFDIDPTHLSHTSVGYGEYFKKYGFEFCKFEGFEQGYITIVLYSDDEDTFTHVARLLPTGRWTSKMGDYEDIEHQSPDVIAGDFYGEPKLYMRRKTNEPGYSTC